MPIYSKDSLETLRRRIDLVEVLSTHIELKRTGSAYKALCPFHDEKSPSLILQKGDTHYHCFGCGAHGDAIQFLMNHLKMSFLDSVESLAQRFQVHLEKVEGENKGPDKGLLKEALDHACRLYQFVLLHTPEGHQALEYLFQRGIDLDFINHFQLGLAPSVPGMLRRVLHGKYVKDETLVSAGLLQEKTGGGFRDFFADRITFPIRDPSGAVIGFSARKYKEETFGGKYVNTPETPLFKKSRVLFGLNYCRRRIAKEQVAIVVEGQIDALRLIYSGFDITVAGQGTAFGESHVKELITLGVTRIFLALDGDIAGQQATSKIGNLFQKEGVEVRVVEMAPGDDPDAFLRKHGPDKFGKLLEKSQDYLTFLVKHLSRDLSMESPAGKNQLISIIATQIRNWSHPVMVHESLRKLAHLTQVPEETIGVDLQMMSNIYIKKSANVGIQTINPDLIVDSDFLRWLLLMGDSNPDLFEIAKANITPEFLRVPICQTIYQTLLKNKTLGAPCDLLSLSIDIDDPEAQVLLSDILEKKVNKDKAFEHFKESVQRILDRNWMEKREELRLKIQSSQHSEDEVTELVKQFDALRHKPKLT